MQTKTKCPDCGYADNTGEPCCSLCGRVLNPEKKTIHTPDTRSHTQKPAARHPIRIPPPKCLGLPVPVFYLTLGLALTPVFNLTPVLGYMGWFFTSLIHEMGHTVVAWFFGSPSFPAISLEGHAAACCREQMVFLSLAMWAGLAIASWQVRSHRNLCILLGLAALVYPALAFTAARSFLHLLGGHLGELTIAVVFFWRAVTGGFTHSRLERGLYALLAWHLVVRNAWLCLRLLFSEAGREWYRTSGSFGLTHDYIRVARDIVGCSLETVAAGMFLVTLMVVPMSLWLGRGAWTEKN